LLRHAGFVLAVHADLPADTVRARFPAQVKIGPAERLGELVHLHLPGIALRALPVAPRQIPYHAGCHYFELDTDGELWKQLDNSSGLALHVAGDLPGLTMACWAIRN
jgi:type VI secretion system protein ImpJ